MRELLEGEGVDLSDTSVDIIEFVQKPMGDDPEVKYRTNKTLMMETFDRGDIQLLESSCTALLALKPEDTEVWRVLTHSRLRLKLWDAALDSARRWIAFEPRALGPRCAEAFALAGTQQDGRLLESRARFAQLFKEVEQLGDQASEATPELQECVWRVDELLEHRRNEEQKTLEDRKECLLSARPATVITGARPPHFFLPNFADSVGPIKVEYCDHEEFGGGQSHHKKLVLTEAVEAGDLLFVQSPLVFGAVEKVEDADRMSEALATAVTTSPRAAILVDILSDDGPVDEHLLEAICDPNVVRKAGVWTKDPEAMIKHIEVCEKVLDRSQLFTGRGYSGIWTLAAMARHSCAPSANYTCFGDVLVARAARPLKAGDEITFGFFDAYGILDLRRQAALEKCGGFWCKCPRCEAESNFDPRVETANLKLRAKFIASSSRVNAIQEELTFKMEAKKKEMEKRYEAMSNTDEGEKFQEGLMGLADRFRNLNGEQVTDDDIADLQDYMPEMKEQELVKVPQDLVNDVMGAMLAFEEEIQAIGLSEQHMHWITASNLMYYGETLVLLRLRSDLEGQRQLVDRMLAGIAGTAPGCFEHQRLAVFLWEVAAQCEDPGLTSKIGKVKDTELVPKERELIRQCLRIRYGDLDPVEEEAAMARVSCSGSEMDENWMWEITWCIGRAPETMSGRGPGGKISPFFGPTVLV
ncbi:unnamed protein product [Polarella glacialis]|nr:unnamed protein product [Polarella glacialis]